MTGLYAVGVMVAFGSDHRCRVFFHHLVVHCHPRRSAQRAQAPAKYVFQVVQ